MLLVWVLLFSVQGLSLGVPVTLYLGSYSFYGFTVALLAL